MSCTEPYNMVSARGCHLGKRKKDKDRSVRFSPSKPLNCEKKWYGYFSVISEYTARVTAADCAGGSLANHLRGSK